MVHFASYPLPMAPFSPLLSWRKTILQAQGNRKRNSVGEPTLKMFGFWKVQKVFDVLVVPASFGKTPFIQTAGSPVNLPPFKLEREIEGGSCVSSQGNIFAGCTLLHFGSLQFFAAEEKEPQKAMAAIA